MSKKNKKKIILVEIKKTSYFLGPFWVKYKIIAADTSYKKEKKIERYLIIFFISYLAVAQPTLGHYRGDRVMSMT